MTISMRLFPVALAFALCGCGGSDETWTPDGDSSDPLNAWRQACVNRINEYRSSEGLPAYTRWTDAEYCSDSEAQSDSETGDAHGAFGQCGESAQNECPGWPSYEAIVEGCLQMMWDEGPGDFAGHGHYLNMSSTSYGRVSCGFYETADGSVWSVQNFQ
jgi:hypothetical protein